MAFKYFLYSDEQIKEKNEVMAKAGKYFIPGYVAINGNRVKFTQLSDSPTIPKVWPFSMEKLTSSTA